MLLLLPVTQSSQSRTHPARRLASAVIRRAGDADHRGIPANDTSAARQTRVIEGLLETQNLEFGIAVEVLLIWARKKEIAVTVQRGTNDDGEGQTSMKLPNRERTKTARADCSGCVGLRRTCRNLYRNRNPNGDCQRERIHVWLLLNRKRAVPCWPGERIPEYSPSSHLGRETASLTRFHYLTSVALAGVSNRSLPPCVAPVVAVGHIESEE